MSTGRKTPLYERHKQLKAKMTDFHGWPMPLQYSEITEEVTRTRSAAGLFDVSHMGRLMVEGQGALQCLQKILTADISRLERNRCCYSLVCNEQGGTVEDLLVYCLGKNKYLLVVNAGNREKVLQWLQAHTIKEDVEICDLTADYAQLALQGPFSSDIMEALTGGIITPSTPGPFRFLQQLQVGGIECLVSRTGYTGEDGFEICCESGKAPALWNLLLDDTASRPGASPAGLGARDVLRLEASLPLYGSELNEKVTPLEAGLERFVAFDRENSFIGLEALLQQKEEGLSKKLLGVEMGRGIPRSGYVLKKEGREIGWISSGTFSPTLNKGIGLAFVHTNGASPGDEVKVTVRGREVAARMVKPPFYRREK